MTLPGKILFITHDTNLTGAPMLLLRLIRLLKERGVKINVLIKHPGGPLEDEFRNEASDADVYFPGKANGLGKRIRKKVFDVTGLGYNRLFSGVDVIVSNTMTNGLLLQAIKKQNKTPIVSYVHELKGVVETWASTSLTPTLKYSDLFLVPSAAVAKYLQYDLKVQSDKILSLNYYLPGSHAQKSSMKQNSEMMVGGCGTRDARKGFDIFIDTAIAFTKQHPGVDVRFIWKGGDTSARLFKDGVQRLKENRTPDLVQFMESSGDMDEFYKHVDVFFLSSREDPYPLVMLEAATWSIPTICFAGTGGAQEFVEGTGCVVPGIDVGAAVHAIAFYQRNAHERSDHGGKARQRVAQIHENAELVVNQFEMAMSKVC